MKKTFLEHILLCLCLFVGTSIYAESVEIDGINYNLISKLKTAEVISKPGAYAGAAGLYTGAVVIPESVIYNGDNYSVTSIGKEAFMDCYYLTSVSIPNSVTSIGIGAFEQCKGLTTISIPSSVTRIEARVFDNCRGLTSVNMPNSITSIGYGAFMACKGLTSIAIPNSVTEIGNDAFRGCSRLFSITIPNGVTVIKNCLFTDCSGLTSVTLPNNVTSIESEAFSGCKSLTSITFPNSLLAISVSAFQGCTGLTSIAIPYSVRLISVSAFQGCTGLKAVTIGQGVKTIDKEAFCNCPELTDVYCLAESVPTTSIDAFKDSYIGGATLHVPASAIEQYKATAPWSDFGSKVPIDGDEPNPEPKKCEAPTISYANGELVFNSETEGAEYVYEITDTDVRKGYSAIVSLTATYNISVYATKAEYENSDTVQAILCWIDAEPRTEGIVAEDAVNKIKSLPILIQSNDSGITIQGAAEGTEIKAYNVNGMLQDTVIAGKGSTMLNTSLRPGSVAIVKIGEKTIKVVIK